MVKGQGRGQGLKRIEGGLGRVVAGAEGFGVEGAARKDHAEGVLSGVAIGPGIDAQQAGKLHHKAGFFLRFAQGGRLRRIRPLR